MLYRIDHYTSLPAVAITVIAAMFALIAVGAAIGFPRAWITGFEVSTSAVTIVLVFTIQHTQGREQTAVQRKLDEILRALPGADESLMMLEEAPPEAMLDIESEQRDVRQMSPDTEFEETPHDRRSSAALPVEDR
jgi:low affinity Fe/Cu permease